MKTFPLVSAALAALLCGAVLPAPAQTPSTAPESDIKQLVGNVRRENIERTIRTLVSFGTRNTLSVQDDPKRGIGAARDYLYNEFLKLQAASGGRLKVEKQTFLQPVAARVPQPTNLTNIIATLPGDAPPGQERYVIVSGHYDSMCTSPTDAVGDAPGANDDASGTAAVLEAARVMVPYRYCATIVFVCVAGEEQGLLGSTYLAEQAKLNNWRVEAMFTNDIIGNSHGANGTHDDKTIRIFSEGIATNESAADAKTRQSVGGENDSASRQLARFVAEVGQQYVKQPRVTLISRRDRYGRGGDHIPFNERGYAAIRFTEPNEDFTHQHQNVRTENGVFYGDTPEYVDFDYVANATRLNVAALAAIASGPDVPQNVGVLTTRLSADTDLRWDASPDPAVARYEIVWRDTTAPTWTQQRSVGKVTRYTVKGISKDNYIFGVRAIDGAGRKSPVAIPRPVR